jgi:hypothetical protein
MKICDKTVQIPAQGDEGPREQFHKAAVADQGGEIGPQARCDILGVIVFEVAVVAAVEIDEDRQNLAEGQLAGADALALAALE